MDFVAQTDDTAIFLILEPTIQAFLPLVEKNRAKIESVEKKTFKYGSTDRHQLDVYYPPSPSSTKPPILVFHYGGAFYSGERSFPPPQELVYTNVGAFFATRGILTVIPDYRLVPNSTYPNPAEDSAEAIKWVVDNLGERGDTERLVLMGHSAGAAIVSTVLLHEPRLITPDLVRRTRGAVLVGGPYHHEGPVSAPPDIISQYYGPPEQLATRIPIALLRNASEQTLADIPKLFLLVSEKDAEGIALAHRDFSKEAKERLGEKVETGVAKGHNHISVNWALSTGEGEDWAEEVVNWVNKVA